MAPTNWQDFLAEGDIQAVRCVIAVCCERFSARKMTSRADRHGDRHRKMIRPWMKFLAGIIGVEVLGDKAIRKQFRVSLRKRSDVVPP
jgi:hypothetical protein